MTTKQDMDSAFEPQRQKKFHKENFVINLDELMMEKRLFYLQCAERNAKNPEFKKLWRKKRKELLRIYNR